MRLMFSTREDHCDNPLFLEEKVAAQGILDSTMRAATDEEVAGLSDRLSKLLVERMLPSAKTEQAVREVTVELRNAMQLFAPFHSAHEAYAVIEEEFVELQKEVFKNHRNRDVAAMRTEACQLAAMAIRMMVELC